jgi:hypothetical protein
MNAEPVASTLLPCMKKNQNFTTHPTQLQHVSLIVHSSACSNDAR